MDSVRKQSKTTASLTEFLKSGWIQKFTGSYIFLKFTDREILENLSTLNPLTPGVH